MKKVGCILCILREWEKLSWRRWRVNINLDPPENTSMYWIFNCNKLQNKIMCVVDCRCKFLITLKASAENACQGWFYNWQIKMSNTSYLYQAVWLCWEIFDSWIQCKIRFLCLDVMKYFILNNINDYFDEHWRNALMAEIIFKPKI